MKMKKYIIPIITAIIGLVIGYFISFDKVEEAHEPIENQTSHESEIWTCSMHPQIRKNEPGNCPICGMKLIPMPNSLSDNYVLEMTEEAIKLSDIQTTLIKDGSTANGKLELSGKILANEEKNASIVTQIPGRIERLFISFKGEQVYKGQKVAEIYSSSLINAQQELLEAKKLENTNPNLLEAAKMKLRNWKVSEVQIESILSTRKVIESFPIYAEYSGVVLAKKKAVGDHLKEGDVLFDIQNLNSLWVVFDAFESDISSLKIGNEINFNTPSLPHHEFSAKISFIDPLINPQSRTVAIRAEVNNAKKLLKPEMFVQGIVQLEKSKNSTNDTPLLVPKTAVLWTGTRSVVYVKVPKTKIPSFEFREIQIGETIGSQFIVLNGLVEGEEVVTKGAFVIDAASQLNNRSSMMNRIISNQK